MGRKPRSILDMMKPNIADRVRHNQQKQKAGHDKGTVQRSFEIGTPIYVKNFTSGPAWLAGNVTNAEGHCSYEIKLSDGRAVRRHGDHIRINSTLVDQPATFTDNDDPLMDPGVPPTQTDELLRKLMILLQYCDVLLATANHLTDLPIDFKLCFSLKGEEM